MTADQINQMAEAMMARDYANFNLDETLGNTLRHCDPNGTGGAIALMLAAWIRKVSPFIWRDGFYAGMKAAMELADEMKRNAEVER